MQSVLDIVLDNLTNEERAAWPEQERIYAQFHSPEGSEAICQVIEIIQKALPKMKLRYARILLRRKIQMREGLFTPIVEHVKSAPIAPIVQCIHCGAEFTNLHRFEHATTHPCSAMDREIWRDLEKVSGPRKIVPANCRKLKKEA